MSVLFLAFITGDTLSGRQRSMRLRNTLKCKGQTSPGRNPPGHNAGRAQAETPWPRHTAVSPQEQSPCTWKRDAH